MFARVDRFESDGIFDLFCACFWPYFCEHSLQRVAKNSPEYISWALACGMFKGAFPMPACEVVARRVSRSEIGRLDA